MLKYVFHSEGERAARRISWYMLWLISHFHRKRRSQLGMISRREKGAAKWDCYGIMGELSFRCQRAIWSLQNTSRYKFVCLLSLSLPFLFLPSPHFLLAFSIRASRAQDNLECCLCLPNAVITGMYNHTWFYGMLGRDPRPSYVCRQVFSNRAISPVHKYFALYYRKITWH